MLLPTASRNAALQAVLDLITATGKLKFRDSGTTVIAEITDLPGTGFEAAGATAAGEANFIGDNGSTIVSGGNPLTITGITAAGAGTAIADAVVTDSADVIRVTLSVGTSGTDIVLDNVNIADGQDCVLSTAKLTQPAS